MAKDNARWLSWEDAQSPWEGAQKERDWSSGTPICPGIFSVLQTTEGKRPASAEPGCPGQTRSSLSPQLPLIVAHPTPCSLFRIGCPSAGSFPLPSILLFIQRRRTALQEGPLDVDFSTVVVMGNISFRICCCNLLSLN